MKKQMRKWLSLFLTALMLFGTFAMAIPAMVVTAGADSAYTDVPANTTVTVNGVKIRYDRYSGNDDGYVHVMPDGTIEFKIRHGDMVWFPDVVMTANSAVHAEVTAVSDLTNIFHGLAYDVKAAAADSHWSTAMVQVVKTAGRYRITPATYANLGNVSGSDRGNGGDNPRVQDAFFSDTEKATTAYKAFVNSNNDWAQGKAASFDLSMNGGTVSVVWGAANHGAIRSTTYTDANATYSFAGGSVGYTPVWAGTDNYITMRFEALTVTNCTVAGANTDLFSAVGTYVTPHTNFTVNGQTYRFDPLDSSVNSSCRIMANNTIRVCVSAGDLLWMPETAQAAGGTLVAKMISNNGQYNSGNLAAGIAYHINLGANGTWGDADDSLNTAHLQTSWRRRIIHATVSGMNSSSTALGIVSNYTLEEAKRSQAYLNFGDRWNNGDVLKTVLSINNSGDVYASFQSEDGTEMNYDYYVPEQSGNKVIDGPIGFVSFWNGDGSERLPMVVDVLSMTPDYTGVKNVRANLSLDGTIQANVAFSASTYVANNANLVVTKAGDEIREVALNTLWNASEKAYVVSIPVAAKEMTDEINVCVKVGDDVVSGSSYTFTVKSLAEATAAAYTDWADVMSAMLTYGAAAQKAFNYNTANLASTATPAFDASAITGATVTGDASFVQSGSLTLSLESGTDLNLYFKPVDAAKTITATAADASAESVSVVTETVDGFFAIRVRNLPAEDLTTVYTVTLTCEDQTFDLTFTALNWVKSVLADDTATADEENLAKAIGAYAAAVAQKKNKLILTTESIASSADVAALRAATDAKIAEILASASDSSVLQTSATNYYVSSSSGSDSNAGTSEAAPLKTLTKLNEKLAGLSSSAKVNVFLKRGDTWRGEQLRLPDNKDNVTVTAYGTGAKPLLLGYTENVGGSANSSKWTNVSGNIWKLDLDSTHEAMDIGNIVVKETADGEETFLRKVVQLYVKSNNRTTDFSHPTDVQKVAFNSYTDLYEDNTFFQPENGDLYVYSASNPATRYASIELAPLLKLINGRKNDHLTIDNLSFGHTGSHAIGLEVGSQMVLSDVTVQNCEFRWIGGSISDYHNETADVSYDLRYGNAIEIYGGCDGFVAQNNYIKQVYDTGITFQMTVNDKTGVYAKDVLFTENVIENCEYSIEYFLTCVNNTANGNGKITNFEISDNYLWNSGYGLSEMRGEWERGYSTHIKAQYGNPCNWATGYVISGNTFVGIRDNFLSIRTSIGGTDSLPTIENNDFYGNYDVDGTALSGKGCRLGEVRSVPTTDTTEIRVSFDQNCDAYLTEQSVPHSGNAYYFLTAPTR